MSNQFFAAISSALALGLTSAAMAVPYYSEDFESRALGSINGQGGWFSGPNSVVQNSNANPGQALRVQSGDTAQRPSLFSPTASQQRLTFDIMIPFTINDVPFADSADIQHTITVRGPSANEQLFVVYKGAKNANQAVAGAGSGVNGFSIRGASGNQESSFIVQSGVWYTVDILEDFGAGTYDAAIYNNSVSWDPVGGQTFYANGNTNNFIVDADGTFDYSFVGDPANQLNPHFDNFSILLPRRAGLLGVAGLGIDPQTEVMGDEITDQ